MLNERPAFGIHSFKNRTDELHSIRVLFEDPSVRITSLLGRRGIGKSLLAVRAARSVAEGVWPDGARTEPVDAVVFFGERTTGITFEQIFFDCLRLLDAHESDRLHRIWGSRRRAADKATELFDALAPLNVLILLDNLEELLDEEDVFREPELMEAVKALLTHESAPRLLITSQVPLALPAQFARAERRILMEEGLPRQDSIALLRELDADGLGGIRDADDALLAETAGRVYGVPRGLELIAGALQDDVSMRSLREWLRDTAALTSLVDELAQRRYRDLDEHHRLVMDVLAVFGTPVPPDAVAWVLGPLAPGLSVDAVLRRLTRGFLARANRENRTYSLLPMDTDIARADLARRAPLLARRLHRRAADWYARTAIPREEWRTPQDVAPQRRELAHRVQAGDYDEAALLLDRFADFLVWQGSAGTVMSMCTDLAGRLTGRQARLAYLVARGHAQFAIGPMNTSIELLQEAESLAQVPQDAACLQRILFLLGDMDRFEGRHSDAVPRLRRSADIASRLGMVEEYAHALLCLSLAHSYADRPDLGLEVAAELSELARGSSLPIVRAREANALACAYAAMREWPRVTHVVEASIIAYDESGIPEALGFSWNTLGLARVGTGDLTSALSAFDMGVERSADVGWLLPEAVCRFNQTWALWRLGRAADAESSGRRALIAYQRCGSKDEAAAAALYDAVAADRSGDPVSAARHLQRCAALVVGNPDLCPAEWFTAAADRLRVR
ncbi:hypothetical protein [Streptomyces sp. JB150]|uniref:hypothetical protein n=1 Tax=Streptomyces sp. JB150 TaxID=2714844 RepID=UPI00140CE3A1|nr:hypothetical protein [Streptomyces sp. JB150]QIJ65005.1 hypothetical protein G7Z13_25495 [Streptomyces sp. JB150]